MAWPTHQSSLEFARLQAMLDSRHRTTIGLNRLSAILAKLLSVAIAMLAQEMTVCKLIFFASRFSLDLDPNRLRWLNFESRKSRIDWGQ